MFPRHGLIAPFLETAPFYERDSTKNPTDRAGWASKIVEPKYGMRNSV